MTDVFREIDEEVRRDKLANIWSKYNVLIMGAALLLVLSVAGWRFYEFRSLKSAEAAGAVLDGAVRDLRDPDKAGDGEKALADLSKADAAGYRIIARFRLIAEQAKSDPAAAALAYDAISADASLDENFRSLGTVRAAMLRVDSLPYAEFGKTIEPLVTPSGPWRHTARELLGVSALKAGEMVAAGRWFDQLVTDPATPVALKQRGDLYLALVRAGPIAAAK